MQDTSEDSEVEKKSHYLESKNCISTIGWRACTSGLKHIVIAKPSTFVIGVALGNHDRIDDTAVLPHVAETLRPVVVLITKMFYR
jgi:hypothetical protein